MGISVKVRIIQKINAMMGKIIEEDQQDVDYAVRHIRTSLMKLGLTFDEVPPMMEQKGDVSLLLTLFGGRFEKTLIHHILNL